MHTGNSRSFALIAQHKVKHTWLRARATVLGHVNALAEGHHQGVEEALPLLFVVVFAEQRLNCLGGTLCVVERNATEEVVDDVVVDDFVEEVTADEACGAIDGSQCALGVGPGLGGVVGNSGVGVLKICDGNCRSRQIRLD